jgi:hypothetical protein
MRFAMAQFTGQLQGSNLEPSRVTIDVSDGRFRIMAGRMPIGSWPAERIKTERTSIYRFSLHIEHEQFEFYPDDPTAFSDAVGAVVDLTEPKGRFGLKERIERAANS